MFMMNNIIIHCETCNDVGSEKNNCENEYSRYFNKTVGKDFHCNEWRQKPPYVVFCEWWNASTLFVSVVTGYRGKARKFKREWISFDPIPEMSEDDITRHRNTMLLNARRFLKTFDLDIDNSWSVYPRWLTTSNDYKKGLIHLFVDSGTTACGRNLNRFNRMPPVEGMRYCDKCGQSEAANQKVIHQI